MIGKYQFLEIHLNVNFAKQIINCENSGCIENFSKEEASKNLKDCRYRSVKCKYCDTYLSFILLIIHYGECPKYQVDFPFKCGYNIERQNLEIHNKTQCENADIKYNYRNNGCETLLYKRNMDEHLKSQNVLVVLNRFKQLLM